MAQEEHGAVARSAKGSGFRFAGGPCRPRVKAFSHYSGYFFRFHFSASPSSLLQCCLLWQCQSARCCQHSGHTPIHNQHYRASSALSNSYLMRSSSAIRLAALSVHDYTTREPNFYVFGLLKVPTSCHYCPLVYVYWLGCLCYAKNCSNFDY